jgi:M-phase inducer tyrosine phosphatase
MEASSPLAAMQQPSMHSMWGSGHEPHGHSYMPAPAFFTSRTFGNFRKPGMKKSSSGPIDYFASNPAGVRGSSPTSSLAADLSQNFHIDKR